MLYILGTTSSKALQSLVLTQSKISFYSISNSRTTNDNEHPDAQTAFMFLFEAKYQERIQNATLKTPHNIHMIVPP